MRAGFAPLLAALALLSHPLSAEGIVLIQSTTSTQNSGLFAHLEPLIEASTGVDLRVVAVGTGQALENARNCDGDLLITHAPEAETTFVEAGFGLARIPFMFNDFVLVGPSEDPAKIVEATGAAEALRRIAEAEALFASRGDDSGTHQKEQALWSLAEAAPLSGDAAWYLETGSGMGATLNVASARGAYSLTDRATWISFGNKGDLRILFEGDPALFNQYAVIRINPAHCPNVNGEGAAKVADWLLSEAGQKAIAAFTVAGQQLFTPNAD